MLHNDESRNDYGLVKIHRNVISSISAIASSEVDGVKCVGKNLKSRFFELLGRRSPSTIRVEFDKNDEVWVLIPIVIKYGYNIPEVAGKVQENVRNSLEKMTNLSIKDININVKSIEKV
ncbi:MAG: Asp23/Gls24 family envelope stress response protein [Candidatus Omnitrophica bacterium]|jgi:uncharacterized alkaline shock family protein YloU|nr:Asp23/Gls24 family envelope stress response protein [Candidatus Omnitrophota bacterium]MDD5078963.1 Asp23/Gls24 family envelope stress response protein [Candidatus Omnitrophota bacterium]